MSSNKITHFPKELENFTNLQCIIIVNNEVSIVENISNNLITLNVTSNPIKMIHHTCLDKVKKIAYFSCDNLDKLFHL